MHNQTINKENKLKKYYIKTFGCQMNVYDSHRIGSILKNLGYTPTSSIAQADLVIFNTCHIREKAAEKVFSDLGRLKIIKDERSANGLDTIIGLVGCVVQAEDEEIARRVPFVDFATGPLTYHRLPEILQKVSKDRETTIIDTEFPAESKFDFLPQNTSMGGASFLAIQEGCNNFCTYCIVPYTRGVETSRPINDIISEAKILVAEGSVEINLLGQNVNSFHGIDQSGKERNLAYLLRELAEIDGLKRIRYTTSYPADVDQDLIECHRDLPQLMPYLHLPVQSGSDKILKAMNRRHSRGQYLDIVGKLKDARKDLQFSSDFIVGFPGETDSDFEDTLDLVNKVKFCQAFSFKYSRRAGTPAAIMPNQVAENIKKERLNILQNLLSSHQLSFNKESIGKIMPVLFDIKGRHKGELIGRTPYMQNLHAEIGKDFCNKIVNVKVIEATVNSLSGIVEGK
ncbi:MAG: tRNA (N6-isopentenyl adenosine(37)-C2)-methylthiotransferase MiaB [Alphaproteobacteria bacterium]|nr:tRNA (N6-isopentenyl adenosine(37)-C2)-methylthiotransferase MiaB [Alphaproteobacteria bacterium]